MVGEMERDFDAEFNYAERKGATFTLGGEKFTTRAILPVGVWRALEDQAKVDENGNRKMSGMEVSIRTIRAALIPDDLPRFDKLLDDDADTDPPISPFQLDRVAGWMWDVIAGRPTESPAPSGDGLGGTSGSKENSPSEAKTGS